MLTVHPLLDQMYHPQFIDDIKQKETEGGLHLIRQRTNSKQLQKLGVMPKNIQSRNSKTI